MCGIHASISSEGRLPPSSELKKLLCNRGPDHLGESEAGFGRHEAPYYLSFTSTVLALRGGHVAAQPFVDNKSGSLLCWNGEAWKIGSEPIGGNDGLRIFEALTDAVAKEDSASNSSYAVLNVLNSISGPFAFVFLDQKHEQIFFGRDRLGRRSLLYSTNSNSVEFSSISDPSRGVWKEVEADAVYLLSHRHGLPVNGAQISDAILWPPSILPLTKYGWEFNGRDTSLGKFNLNRSIPSGVQELNSRSESVNMLRYYLCESLKPRVLNIPVPPGPGNSRNTRIAILFSGGLDCTVLARMTHDLLPLDYQIDLLNVAFENPRVIQAAMSHKKAKRPARGGAGIIVDEDEASLGTDKNTINKSPYESCPDRETGRKAFQELGKVCPARVWRFVAVDIPYAELLSHRTNVINLIHPHNTEMDLSIAYALYFAARGTGTASSLMDLEATLYTTPARVLLSGLGADELFGGYTRHATAFIRKGFVGLLDELELDINRLGKRNLGRDDRIISHWGREVRFPYLDESLVKWAVNCPVWEKCGFQIAKSTDEPTPEIEAGKKILRLLAYELGMHSVAHERKRAIQFGARTAKMELGRTKGTARIS